MADQKVEKAKLIEYGECVCTYEPRGDGGLEGFTRNTTYSYQKMKDERGIYYRVYLNDNYYECAVQRGQYAFAKFFKITFKKEVE